MSVSDTTVLDKGMRENAIPIIISLDVESGIERWPDGSLVDASFHFHKEDLVEEMEQINKEGE